MSEPIITPWDRSAPVTGAAIESRFASEGLVPYAWSNNPGDLYAEHRHAYHKVLYCVSGSITFLSNGRRLTLQPGDRLELPAGIPHSAIVGPEGVICLEAARPPESR